MDFQASNQIQRREREREMEGGIERFLYSTISVHYKMDQRLFPGSAPWWRSCFSVTWFDKSTQCMWVGGCIMTDCIWVLLKSFFLPLSLHSSASTHFTSVTMFLQPPSPPPFLHSSIPPFLRPRLSPPMRWSWRYTTRVCSVCDGGGDSWLTGRAGGRWVVDTAFPRTGVGRRGNCKGPLGMFYHQSREWSQTAGLWVSMNGVCHSEKQEDNFRQSMVTLWAWQGPWMPLVMFGCLSNCCILHFLVGLSKLTWW